MATTITRVAHACALLDFDGQALLTDPWFSEKPGYYRGEPLAWTPATLSRLSAVVASHDHYDHTTSARSPPTVPIELAGHGPGWSAAPNGRGLPGCLPWSGEAGRSWCRVAAGGLVGWRVSWVRAGCRMVRGRVWAGRAASAGADGFPVTRRLARCPSPRRPITSAAAWCPVAFG
jgi:hypothetical protein